MDKYMKEVIKLLKNINKQNDTIIKHLISIDDVNLEANGYVINDDMNEEFFGYDNDSKNSGL